MCLFILLLIGHYLHAPFSFLRFSVIYIHSFFVWLSVIIYMFLYIFLFIIHLHSLFILLFLSHYLHAPFLFLCFFSHLHSLFLLLIISHYLHVPFYSFIYYSSTFPIYYSVYQSLSTRFFLICCLSVIIYMFLVQKWKIPDVARNQFSQQRRT
jgi:hypothetical protein